MYIILTSLSHADGTNSGRHAVHVALRSDTHGGGHRQRRTCRYFDRPLHLFHVLEVLHRPWPSQIR